MQSIYVWKTNLNRKIWLWLNLNKEICILLVYKTKKRDMKKGNIMRDVVSSSQFTENVIKEYKKGVGDVVLVAITPRTTIELPAHLTQAEIDARVEIYKKLHSSKV